MGFFSEQTILFDFRHQLQQSGVRNTQAEKKIGEIWTWQFCDEVQQYFNYTNLLHLEIAHTWPVLSVL